MGIYLCSGVFFPIRIFIRHIDFGLYFVGCFFGCTLVQFDFYNFFFYFRINQVGSRKVKSSSFLLAQNISMIISLTFFIFGSNSA